MKKQILAIVVMLTCCTLYAQKGQPSNQPTKNKPGQLKDTLPIIRPVDKINNNAVIKLPLVQSVPAEAFQASNENGNNGYYKIRRDGLGTLAGTGETINNSLVAPLQLPDGAVISKVYFNILSLYPHGYFPHLRLVQRGIANSETQKGAYSINTAINTYSVNSMGMNTATGLLDVKTLVADGLNYKINNKSSSYFFEVLANKSDRPPVDARSSFWPNDNYLFIWSVEVYYSMPQNTNQ